MGMTGLCLLPCQSIPFATKPTLQHAKANPACPQQISSAIEKLLSDEKQAEEMGKNGRKAVEEVYNWGIEEKKLLNTYEEILK